MHARYCKLACHMHKISSRVAILRKSHLRRSYVVKSGVLSSQDHITCLSNITSFSLLMTSRCYLLHQSYSIIWTKMALIKLLYMQFFRGIKFSPMPQYKSFCNFFHKWSCELIICVGVCRYRGYDTAENHMSLRGNLANLKENGYRTVF